MNKIMKLAISRIKKYGGEFVLAIHITGKVDDRNKYIFIRLLFLFLRVREREGSLILQL